MDSGNCLDHCRSTLGTATTQRPDFVRGIRKRLGKFGCNCDDTVQNCLAAVSSAADVRHCQRCDDFPGNRWRNHTNPKKKTCIVTVSIKKMFSLRPFTFNLTLKLLRFSLLSSFGSSIASKWRNTIRDM